MHIRARHRRFLLVAALAFPGWAAAQADSSLLDLSLEQLSNVQVTSVGKRLQRLADVPGSVYVIRASDIRRSGALTLPEVLRLAPNLQVARASATEYAITARSGADLLANKMLVLVDGRTVYSPLFSGVFWEAQDVLLEDVDRIEVLSGSGGTLYGSNAFNGVINIITKGAGETQGTVAKLAGGSEQRFAAVRHGGQAGGFAWRAYVRRNVQDNTERADGSPVRDASRRSQAGFRADRIDRAEQLTLQGDVFEQHIEQPGGERRYAGGNLLARYTRDAAGGRLQLQGYVDRAVRDRPGNVFDTMDTLDLELQHQSQPRAGHELLLGAGWRHQHDDATNVAPAIVQLVPAERRLNLWNLFVQDEVALARATRLTLGLKAEHNSYTGLEWLPNARLAWEPRPGHLLWGAVSRVVRVPARVDRDTIASGLQLSPQFESEVAWVSELGWRAQLDPALALSATAFHHAFSRLRSADFTGPGAITFNNHYKGRLTGVEAWAEWRPHERWRLTAGAVAQQVRYTPTAGTAPLPAASTQGNDARHRFMLSSAWDLGRGVEFDVQLRRVGARPEPAVPAYTALDLRLGWRVRPDLELSLAARNINDPWHAEWGAAPLRSEIPRSVLLQATWRL